MPTEDVSGGAVTTGGAAIGGGGVFALLSSSSFGPTSLSRGTTKLPEAFDGIGALP